MLPYILIAIGALMRLLPHAPNVAPIAALALFGGTYLRRWQAFALPLAALVASDALIGFDSLKSRLTVYGAFALVGVLGIWLRRHKHPATVAGASIAGSTLFYLITNFAFLYPTSMYPHTLAGVVSSYYNALPFFRNTMGGDLCYTALLFGAYELALATARSSADTKKTELII
jgi:hypothetical protein